MPRCSEAGKNSMVNVVLPYKHTKCQERDVDLNCSRPLAACMGALTTRLSGKRLVAHTAHVALMR